MSDNRENLRKTKKNGNDLRFVLQKTLIEISNIYALNDIRKSNANECL